MALRLRRDVQKASYYVWFLGAEEARGLRGPRVIHPVVPYLIERSRQQEPLKVTLQVSHKGIKILQGSSKHFIPHSAITSSVQIDDIVACVLLLYNPATKCPLHVHGYRCDSETTAEALNQKLQILINRPENQKRFSELESRLGIPPVSALSSVPEQNRVPRRLECSPKRFESSLGSDTGTSTRESECSEEHCLSTSISSLPKPKGDIFDSLAAELRAKLNGNGPPLLLPPRDYDTVHRSKGNLASIELRRCRNRLIVGATTTPSKQIVSSRGSSGIGSDLAPSPERHDNHSSSDEENWSHDVDNPLSREEPLYPRRPTEITGKYRSSKEKIQTPVEKYRHDSSHNRSLSRERDAVGEIWTTEDEIRPVIMRPSNFDARFKKVLLEKSYHDRSDIDFDNHHSKIKEDQIPIQDRKYRKHTDDKKPLSKYGPDMIKYNNNKRDKPLVQSGSKIVPAREVYDNYDDDYDSESALKQNENLTDKQKYHEAYIKKDKIDSKRYSSSPKYRDSDEIMEMGKGDYYSPSDRVRRPPPTDHHRYEREYYPRDYNERNAYIKHDSTPYRESFDARIKSPVSRYKSFDDVPYRQDYFAPEAFHRDDRHSRTQKDNPKYEISPKDRFNDAKEKFRAMERKVSPHNYNEYYGRDSYDRSDSNGRFENWSDDEHSPRKDMRGGGDSRQQHKYDDRCREQPPFIGITNSKSLSNLAKGYRHSYADNRPVIPRSGGRVNLATVNPF